MKRQSDHFTKKAKSMGYPARSVFKLEEIDSKFHVLNNGPLLDIGAAPGSWSLYCLKRHKGPVIGVDLQDVNIPDADYVFFKGDVFDHDMQAKLSACGPFGTIISDAAPSTTGNRTVDTSRSSALVEEIIRFSCGHLANGGNLVVKVFQGGDERSLVDLLNKNFNSVKPFKPRASRDESFEIFLIAKGFSPRREGTDR